MYKIEINDVNDLGTQDPSNLFDWDVSSSTYTDLSYDVFFHNHLLKNVPCAIKNVTSTWECSKNWVNGDTINYDYFIDKYGELEAPVADCDSISFNSQCKSNMRVGSYVEYLRKAEKTKLLYLKDWHLRKLRPLDKFYDVPEMFASDWLNEYAQDNQEDDFMFVYIGPKDSWTPLHADVYSSYSWSVNVVGKKKWLFFPPGEEEKLKDSLGNIPLTYDSIVSGVKCFEVIQEKGDAIFVPSGWYHQVTNLEDTISINHNWVNGCNIEIIWQALVKTLISVEKEINEYKDTPEFPSQCQLILKSLFGMDCAAFLEFICYIGKKRLYQLQSGCGSVLDRFTLGLNQIKFDLKSILKVMNLIITHPVSQNKYFYTSIKYDFIVIKNSISKAIS